MAAIAGDVRIGTTHIALYTALYDLWLENGEDNCLDLHPSQVMDKAKILARSTYVKTIRELHEGGYLVYQPSCSSRSRSKVRF